MTLAFALIPAICAGSEATFSFDIPGRDVSSTAVSREGSRQELSGWALPAHAGRAKKASQKGPAATGVSALPDTVKLPDRDDFDLIANDPLNRLRLTNIKPLYESPPIPREGVWISANMPKDSHGVPIFYTTVYRPSVNFPNAVVYMMVVDLKRAFLQYYVGSQEPGGFFGDLGGGIATALTIDLRYERHVDAKAFWRGRRHFPGKGDLPHGRRYGLADSL